ncbi:MAG: hypothetical protein ABF285_04870 [Pacificibacter sp.]|uniref:hypothetical protein n=1 Tax=Pacificibacter sp. TaxID=1917866 RepID=UPI0032197629
MDDTEKSPPFGTIIRAKNGDVLGYDSTGLLMVLSDSVIENIAERLPEKGSASTDWIDPRILGNVDAWDIRRSGEWLLFHANLEGQQGIRQFRRLEHPKDADSAPSIFADGAGPLLGVLSLGGPRRATTFETKLKFPWHVLAPADEIGAAGYAGTETAAVESTLQRVPEMTRDTALSDAIVARQHRAHEALSLLVTRTETDSSSSISDFVSGAAYENFLTAIKSLKAAADRLNRPAALYAIGLDFALEDVWSDPSTYQYGIFALVAQITADIAKLNMRCPPILAHFDCGTHHISDHPILRAQTELAWQGATHGLCYTAPSYMFKQDRFGRPDSASLANMAEIDACALEALHDDKEWLCPTFLLAEREANDCQIRVRARALSDLVIDKNDPFGSGACCGFSLSGADNAPELVDVSVCADDPQDIILTFDKAPTGSALEVLYAFGQDLERADVDFPSACGSVRDTWAFETEQNVVLHRWAMPAAIPVW